MSIAPIPPSALPTATSVQKGTNRRFWMQMTLYNRRECRALS